MISTSGKRTHSRSRTSSNSNSNSDSKNSMSNDSNNYPSTSMKKARLSYRSWMKTSTNTIADNIELIAMSSNIEVPTQSSNVNVEINVNSNTEGQSPPIKIFKKYCDRNKYTIINTNSIVEPSSQQKEHTTTMTVHSSTLCAEPITLSTKYMDRTVVSTLSPRTSTNNIDNINKNMNISTMEAMSSSLLIKSELMQTSSNLYSSHNAPLERKRRASNSLDKDPDLGFEAPSAKRQQRLPSLYQSDADSVVSSVYPSPVDDLVNEIDTHSPRSDCPSPLSGTEFDLKKVYNIPNSPHSQHETAIEDTEEDNDDDGDDDDGEDEDEDEEDEEIVSSTSSPSVSSTCSPTVVKNNTTCETCPSTMQYVEDHFYGERTPAQHYADNNVEDQKHRCVKSFDGSEYDCMTPATDSELLRQCPLPALSWANAYDVWKVMCKNDEQAMSLRDTNMLKHHPSLQPRMRAILLDWLIEVCEVYKLHRETYYLALDYLDRYLSSQKRVQKTHLQLIGITCLFVAAKVEEIYPPKIGEFAYVTDGACQESDILQHEILLLQSLDWDISPVTPMGWLSVYMQLQCNNRTPKSFNGAETATTSTISSQTDDAFIFPQFSGMQFVQTAQLLDLCSLDVGFASYSYSVLAAAAISHIYSKETAVACSGLDWQFVAPCARWMTPFFSVISKESPYLQLLEQNEQYVTRCGFGVICPKIVTDNSHIIQTHTTTMAMFDQACMLQEQDRVISKIKQEASPATGLACPEGLLTPPASSRKPLGIVDENVAIHTGSSSNTVISESTAKNL